MTGAVQVVLVRLLWENSAISIAEHNENWLFFCLTAPCELGSFPTDIDTGALAYSTPWGCHLRHAFSQFTMEQEERMEIVMSQAREGWHTCCPPLMATTQSPGSTLTPRKCRLAKYLAGEWNVFGDQLALLWPWKRNNFLLWDRAVCCQQALYFHSQDQMSHSDLGRECWLGIWDDQNNSMWGQGLNDEMEKIWMLPCIVLDRNVRTW